MAERTGGLGFASWAAASAVWLAFAAACVGLRAQGMWGDEGALWARSVLPLAELLPPLVDNNGPAYPLLLAGWAPLAGMSEFALRFPSAAGFSLAAAGAASAGRALGRAGAGAMAAVLIAASPLALVYGREVRMYAVAIAISALLLAIAVRGARSNAARGTPAWWAALASVGALLHYFVVFAAIGAALVAAGWWARSRSRTLAWLGAASAPGVAAGLYIAANLGLLAGQQPREGQNLAARLLLIVEDAARALIHGEAGEGSWLAALPLLFLALASLVRRRPDASMIPAALGAGATVAACIAALALPVWSPRYVLLWLPAWALASALGAQRLAELFRAAGRVGATLAALAVLLAAAPALSGFASGVQNGFPRKSGYREAMARIAAEFIPGDGVLLLNHLQEPLFDYYGPKGIESYWFPLPESLGAPQSRATLAGIASSYGRLWLMEFGDPGESDPARELARWLAANAFPLWREGYSDSALSLWALPASLPANSVTLGHRLGEWAILESASVAPPEAAPGSVLFVTLRWRVLAPSREPQTVFVQLLGEATNPSRRNRIWAQQDSQPAGGARPTTTWRPGEVFEDRYALAIDPGAPEDEYTIVIGLYSLATGQRANVLLPAGASGGDLVEVARVRVRPR